MIDPAYDTVVAGFRKKIQKQIRETSVKHK